MPRGSGAFRVRPSLDVQGRIVYRNEAVALGLLYVLVAVLPTGMGALLLWDTGVAWEGAATVIGAVLILAGLFVLGVALHMLFERQELLLDPAERVAVFTVKTLLGRRHVRCDYADLRLEVHEMAYVSERTIIRTSWRGWAVVFHLPGERFVIGQIGALEAAERCAAETAEQTGVAWQRSPEKIELGANGVA